MNIFKKKQKQKDDEARKVSIAAPEIPAKTPTLKPACGYEYDGKIYKTAAEANHEHQKNLIRNFVAAERKMYAAISALCSGPDHRWALENWSKLVEIANTKLEIE